MRIKIILVLLIFSNVVLSQITVAEKKDAIAFKKTLTAFVLSDNPFSKYNDTIKKVVAKYWKATPYSFIDLAKFETLLSNPKYSFIIVSEVALNEGSSIDEYLVLNFVMGEKDANDINLLTDLGSVPLAYKGCPEDEYLYKMGVFMQFMQYYINQTAKGKSYNPTEFLEYCAETIKNKELWLVKEDLADNINEENEIKAIYPYKFKIVSKKEINEAIQRKDKNVAILHKIGTTKEKIVSTCLKCIVSVDNGEILYSNTHQIDKTKKEFPDAFLEKDFLYIVQKFSLKK